MRKYIVILLISVFAALSLVGRAGEGFSLSVEQEQQFTYYWYAAKQAIEQERYPDALVLLEFCRLIKPNDGQTLTFLAIMYEAIGQKERAMETFRQAFEADPRDQWKRYYYALREQRTPEAYKEAARVIEKAYLSTKGQGTKRLSTKGQGTKDEELLEQLRRTYLQNGQWKKSLAVQDEIDALRGVDAYSAANRCYAYRIGGKEKKALAVLDSYLETDPTNIQILVMRMEIMEHSRVPQAELYALYERILELDPGNLLVLNNYAYHLATHKGDLQRAERMSAVTIREEPANPVYLDTYGWILHMQGQDELALFYLRRAQQNIPPDMNRVLGIEIQKHIEWITRHKK
ncbi:MAG: tetratricopeptide repeat protein [Paludibacteraceae bacterium]|nr:tetratricopeptide repeat protein [Paludibacteraceae bacterium]